MGFDLNKPLEGIGTEFLEKHLREKIDVFQMDRDTPEQRRKDYAFWVKEAKKYEKAVISELQGKVIKKAKVYHKRFLTEVDIEDVFITFHKKRVSGKFVPETVRSSEMQMAWITKMGDNPSRLANLFPNLVDKSLPPIRRHIWCNHPMNYEEKKEYKSGNTIHRNSEDVGTLVDPLVILYYALYCDKYGDKLISVKSGRLNIGLIHPRLIKIETYNYKIRMQLSKNKEKNFDDIVIERREV